MPYQSLAQQGFYTPYIAAGDALRGNIALGTNLYNEYKPGGTEDERRQQMAIAKQQADNARMLALAQSGNLNASTAQQQQQTQIQGAPGALNTALASQAGKNMVPGTPPVTQPSVNGAASPSTPAYPTQQKPSSTGEMPAPATDNSSPASVTPPTAGDSAPAPKTPKSSHPIGGVQNEGQPGAAPAPQMGTPGPGYGNALPNLPDPASSPIGEAALGSFGAPVSKPAVTQPNPDAVGVAGAGSFASQPPSGASFSAPSVPKTPAAPAPTPAAPVVSPAAPASIPASGTPAPVAPAAGMSPGVPPTRAIPNLPTVPGQSPVPTRLKNWNELDPQTQQQIVQAAVGQNKFISPGEIAQAWDSQLVPAMSQTPLTTVRATPDIIQNIASSGLNPAKYLLPGGYIDTMGLAKDRAAIFQNMMSGSMGDRSIHADPNDPNSPEIERITHVPKYDLKNGTFSLDPMEIKIDPTDQQTLAKLPKEERDLVNTTSQQYLERPINKTYVSEIAPKMFAIEHMMPNINSNQFKDMDLLNSYAGITRPGAIVRDSTVEMDLENAGIENALARKYSEAMGKGGLSPEDRANIAQAAKTSFEGYRQQAGADMVDGADRMVEQTGLDRDKVGRMMYGPRVWSTIRDIKSPGDSAGGTSTPSTSAPQEKVGINTKTGERVRFKLVDGQWQPIQ